MSTTIYRKNMCINAKNSAKNIRNLEIMNISDLITEEISERSNNITQETIIYANNQKGENNEKKEEILLLEGELPNNSTNDVKNNNHDEFIALYAIDNYTSQLIFKEHEITFNIYVIFHNTESVKTIAIQIQLINKNSRLLEEERPFLITCNKDSDSSLELVKYFCISYTERDIKNKKLKGIGAYIYNPVIIFYI